MPHSSRPSYELLVLYARDFFGDPLPEAELRFVQKGKLKYLTKFENGRVEIKIPEQLAPGIYDTTATRIPERSDEPRSEYRIADLIVPFATHYFRHARTHSDIKALKDGNFSSDILIPIRKTYYPLHHLLRSVSDSDVQKLKEVALHNGNHARVAWGGLVRLVGSTLHVSRGEASLAGRIISWGDSTFEVPPEEGMWSLGIRSGALSLADTPPELMMATATRDSYDWLRLNVKLPVQPLLDTAGEPFYFADYENEVQHIQAQIGTREKLDGSPRVGAVYSPSGYGGKVSKISMAVEGNSPVLTFDRFLLEAQSEYLLLWLDTGRLLAALPRFKGSNVALNWEENLTVSSWGEDGHVSWSSSILVPPCSFKLWDDRISLKTEYVIEKTLAGAHLLARHDAAGWNSVLAATGNVSWVA